MWAFWGYRHLVTTVTSESMFRALVLLSLVLPAANVIAHGVAAGDGAFMEQSTGWNLIPFIYLGAKHMVTGYDHLLFLFGVIFFLYRAKEVGVYVTLFAIGHSVTLLYGVLGEIYVNPYLVDTIIGLSVVYKGFDNIGGFRRLLGYQPNTRVAVLIFGFVHGFGLATKLQDYALSDDGLVANILAFNVGVELGQLLALFAMLTLISIWRQIPRYTEHAFAINSALMSFGFMLMGYQISGYFFG